MAAYNSSITLDMIQGAHKVRALGQSSGWRASCCTEARAGCCSAPPLAYATPPWPPSPLSTHANTANITNTTNTTAP